MFSEYLLSDWGERGSGSGGGGSGGSDGSGCLVVFAILGSMIATGIGGLITAIVF